MNKKHRTWLVTIHKQNMYNAGFTEKQLDDYPMICEFFLQRWINSGKNRTGCIVACKSKNGVFHLHGALCGEGIVLKSVAKIMFNSHVVPNENGKANLLKYILKEPPYDEKGEDVLYKVGENNIIKKQGKRTDLEAIKELINEGYTPEEIFNENIAFRKHEKIILGEFISKKRKEVPNKKKMYCEWNIFDEDVDYEVYYDELVKQYGSDNIYITGNMNNGWLDDYMPSGAPNTILIMDLARDCKISELIEIMDIYSKKNIHARYKNVYALWNNVVIVSYYSPEEIYVYSSVKHSDKRLLKRLIKKLDVINYFYMENDNIKKFTILASEYKDLNDIKDRIRGE